MKLIVDLDDGTDAGRLAMILDTLSVHRAYIRGAVLAADDGSVRVTQEGPPALSEAELAELGGRYGPGDDDSMAGGGGLGTEWW